MEKVKGTFNFWSKTKKQASDILFGFSMLALDFLPRTLKIIPLSPQKENPQRELWFFCFMEKVKGTFNFWSKIKKQASDSLFGFSMLAQDFLLGTLKIIPLSPLNLNLNN